MSQGQKSPYEDIILFFIVVGIVGGITYAIWFFFHTQISYAVIHLRIGELWVIEWLGNAQRKLAEITSHGRASSVYLITDPDNGGSYSPQAWRRSLGSTDYPSVKFDDMIHLASVVVPNLRMLFIALMVGMASLITIKGPGTHYRRRMNLEQLMQEQAKSFPAIQPFLKFDPRKLPFRAPGQPVPSQLPLFSEALAPEEWLAYHEVKVTAGVLDRNAAWAALAEQLGGRWEGPEKLPIHAQGIYAACALKHVRKRKDCEEMLNMLSLAWDAEKGFRPSAKLRSKIRAVINNPKTGGALRKYADQHAYNTTALARCLSRAREEGGVLAPAEFLWLRGQDRALWYPLNNLGRKSYCAEASGALVHYTNELIAGQKIPTPRFDEVIQGFEKYIKSGSARAIPELDKKAGGSKYYK